MIIDGVGNNAAMKACGENSWWLSLLLLKTKERDARATCAGISSMAGGAWEVSMEVMTQAASLLVESDVAIYNAALSALAGPEMEGDINIPKTYIYIYNVFGCKCEFMQNICVLHTSHPQVITGQSSMAVAKNNKHPPQATIDGEQP